MKKRRPISFWWHLVLLAAIIFSLSFYRICDPDIWLYLKTGEAMMNGDFRIAFHDAYSYTDPGAPWLNHSWLSQLLLFFCWRALGVGGLYLFRYLVLCLTFWLIFLTAGKKGSTLIATWLTLISILAASQRFVVRPELFTFLCLSLLLFILEKWREEEPRRLYLLPILFLFWANLHGGFIIGLLILGSYCLGELLMNALHFPRSRDRGLIGENHPYRQKPALRLAVCMVFCISAAMINPAGPRVFFYSLQIAKMSKFIYAWQPLAVEEWRWWSLSQMLFPALLALAAAFFILNWKRLNLSHLCLFLIFAFLSLKAGRNIYLFAIVAPLLIAHNARNLPFNRVGPRAGAIMDSVTIISLALILAGTVLFPLRESDPFRNDIHREFGWGISSASYPLRVTEFISRFDLPGRMFNSFGIGNYLIWKLWPERRIFIDGRLTVYDLPFLLSYNQILLSPDLFPVLAGRWGLTYTVVDHPNPSNRRLLKWLEESPGWELAGFDANSALYLSRVIPSRAAICERGLQVSLFSAGDSPREEYLKARFLLTIGRASEALPLLASAEREFPRSASVQQKIAQANVMLKKWENAGKACEKALAFGGEKGPLLLLLANLHFAREEWAKAREAAEKALELQPHEKEGHELLGDACVKLGERKAALSAYLRAAEEKPPDFGLIGKLADTFFLEGDYLQAARWYEKIPITSPSYPAAQVYLAGCFAGLKEYGKAGELYRRCADRYPEYAQMCWYNLAKISAATGDSNQVMIWLDKVSDPALLEKIAGDPDLKKIKLTTDYTD